MSYLWTITEMERASQSGGVITVFWLCMKHDGEHTGAVSGSINFTPDPSSSEFVPYERLSEQTVLGWVWSALSKVDVEQQVEKKLAEMCDPPILTGMPWQMSMETET